MDIVEEMRKFAKEECFKPTSKYGREPYEFHFVPMARYAERLVDEMGADKEVVLLAVWLHDLGSIIYGRDDHHITGAKIAEEKLKGFNYPAEKIELVKKCILNHRGSRGDKPESVEERIITDADALSNFDNIGGIFKAAFLCEGLTQGEARIAVRNKLENKWKKLSFENSKKIIKPKYEAVMLLLKGDGSV